MIASDVENLIGGSRGHADRQRTRQQAGPATATTRSSATADGPIGPSPPGRPTRSRRLRRGVLDGGPGGQSATSSTAGTASTWSLWLPHGQRQDLPRPLQRRRGDITGVENVKAGGRRPIVGNDGQNTLPVTPATTTSAATAAPTSGRRRSTTTPCTATRDSDVLSAGKRAQTRERRATAPTSSAATRHRLHVATRTAARRQCLARQPCVNDGSAGEGDKVLDDTENVIGSKFRDKSPAACPTTSSSAVSARPADSAAAVPTCSTAARTPTRSPAVTGRTR